MATTTTETTTTTTTKTGTVDRGDGYQDFEALISARGAALGWPLFTTDAADLGELYLSKIDAASRQIYNCRSCLSFIDRFGGLVAIDERGMAEPVLWAVTAPAFFAAATEALRARVHKARVNGVFVSDLKTWGHPVTDVWRHLAVADVPSVLVHEKRLSQGCDHQVTAVKRQEFAMLSRAIAEFPAAVVEQALAVVKSEQLYRGEHVLGVAEWLHQLHAALAGAPDKRARECLIWRAVATAPAGFCHVRSTMIGTLLEDIAAGGAFADISRRFAKKMNPLQYRRPTAPPAAGKVARAEKLIEELGAAGSLARRFATVDEIPALWRPRPPEDAKPAPKTAGVFGHLLGSAKPAPVVEVPPVTMTLEKFQRTVLPDARRLEYLVTGGTHPFVTIVTAVNPDAPRIFQFDHPFTWYQYAKGSYAEAWGMKPGWAAVVALTYKPSMWGENPQRFARHGASIIFLLEGCADRHHAKSGAGIFPELLIAELHEVRATLEAYSRTARIAGEPAACGISLSVGRASWDARVRVNGAQVYCLDRWD